MSDDFVDNRRFRVLAINDDLSVIDREGTRHPPTTDGISALTLVAR